MIWVQEEVIHGEIWVGAILRARLCAGVNAKSGEQLSPARARLQLLCTRCFFFPKHTPAIGGIYLPLCVLCYD